MLRPTGVSSCNSVCYAKYPIHQECRAFEYEPISEVRSQYVPYDYVPRVETLKMPANLRFEDLDLQPEYRNAYCARYDRQGCDELRTTHGRDDRNPNTRKEHYWLNSGDQCDKTVVAQGQDAFCVLNTRIHAEGNVTGKPPPASRRYGQVYRYLRAREEECWSRDSVSRRA